MDDPFLLTRFVSPSSSTHPSPRNTAVVCRATEEAFAVGGEDGDLLVPVV